MIAHEKGLNFTRNPKLAHILVCLPVAGKYRIPLKRVKINFIIVESKVGHQTNQKHNS